MYNLKCQAVKRERDIIAKTLARQAVLTFLMDLFGADHNGYLTV